MERRLGGGGQQSSIGRGSVGCYIVAHQISFECNYEETKKNKQTDELRCLFMVASVSKNTYHMHLLEPTIPCR